MDELARTRAELRTSDSDVHVVGGYVQAVGERPILKFNLSKLPADPVAAVSATFVRAAKRHALEKLCDPSATQLLLSSIDGTIDS